MASDAARRSLVRQLDAIGVPYELIAHRPTQTALEEAEALGVQASRVAKTIVLTTSVGFVRAVLPASRRLDLDKVRDLLGTKRVELASEHVLARRYPDFDLGAVPPLAGSPDDRVLVDGRLVGGKTVLIESRHARSVAASEDRGSHRADRRAARRPLQGHARPRVPALGAGIFPDDVAAGAERRRCLPVQAVGLQCPLPPPT